MMFREADPVQPEFYGPRNQIPWLQIIVLRKLAVTMQINNHEGLPLRNLRDLRIIPRLTSYGAIDLADVLYNFAQSDDYETSLLSTSGPRRNVFLSERRTIPLRTMRLLP